MKQPRIALCLPGGGVTGAMYQIGALAALEDAVADLDVTAFDLYVGASSGATVAAALAGGRPAVRIYRAFLDPSDVYFPLERKHLFRMDLEEWSRTLTTARHALQRGVASVLNRGAESPAALWAEFDRFHDSLPAGLFSLDAYERFLEAFFLRRGVPNRFAAMPRALRILALDLDTGEDVVFGGAGYESVAVARACTASMAVPPLYSPVRIGDRYFIDAGHGQVSHLDVAAQSGVDVLVVVNPLVPVRVASPSGGSGPRPTLRDKGSIWVMHQAMRMGIHRLMRETCARIGRTMPVILLEPEPTEGILFMHNPSSFSARRTILEHAYRTTRAKLAAWLEQGDSAVARACWRPREAL